MIKSKNEADWFWSYKVHNNEKYDLILLGDSRLYRGISPQAMETVLSGYRVLNFGFSSGGLNDRMYREAERRLSVGGPEKIIVLAVTPHALTAASSKNEHFLKELNRSKDDVLQRMSYDPFFDFFKPLTPKMLKKRLDGEKLNPEIFYYQKFNPDGWVASHTIPSDEDRASESYIDIFLKYQVDEKIVDELCAQTKKWVERGIKVFAFRVTGSEDILVLEDELSGFDQEKVMSQFVDQGGVWLDMPLSGYKTYDGSHLHRDSAVAYSFELANRLKSEI